MRFIICGRTETSLFSLYYTSDGIPYQRINELINRKRGITPSTALRLSRFFDVSPEFWLNLQTRWDLYRAEKNEQAELETIQDYHSLQKMA